MKGDAMSRDTGPSAAQLLADWREAERELDEDDGSDRERLEATVAEAARAFQHRVAELLGENGPPSPSAPLAARSGVEG